MKEVICYAGCTFEGLQAVISTNKNPIAKVVHFAPSLTWS